MYKLHMFCIFGTNMCWCLSVGILRLKQVRVACVCIFGTNRCWCLSVGLLTLKQVRVACIYFWNKYVLVFKCWYTNT